MILVSFDGPEEIHDRCRQCPGAYRAAYEGLQELRNCRERLGKHRPYIMTSTTLSQANVDVLNETFQIGEGLRPDVMVVYLSWFTSEAIGRAQEGILKDHFAVEAYTWQSYVRRFTEQEAQTFALALDNVRSKKWTFEYIVIPDLRGQDVKDYYLDPARLFGYARCVAPFLMIDVMPNGDVVTCRDFTDVKVGNITQSSLLEIWNGPGFVKFRKLLIDRGGTLPQCSRCCGLMGF